MTISEHRPTTRRVVHPDVPGPIGPRPGLRQRLAYSIRIRRVELLPAELPSYVIPALLSVRSGGELLSAANVIAFLTVLSGMHFISMMSALADRDVDAMDKPMLSDAVYELGLRNVRRQIGITGAVVVGLATYLSAATGHWDILPLVAAMLGLAAWYSIRPVHRTGTGAGTWQIPTLILILIRLWLPMLLIVRTLSVGLEWTILAAIAGFGVCQVGIMLVSAARSMAVATVMVGIGGAAACAAVLAIGGLTAGLVLMAAAVVLALLHMSGTWRAVRGLPVDEAVRRLRARAKLIGLQVAATGWATVLAAAFVLAGR